MKTTNRHGFVKDMPNDEYHASNGISKTGLDKVSRSPAHYKHPKPFSQTRAMEIGSAIHCAILEPERYDAEYTVADSAARNTKEYKAAVKENPLGKEYTLTTVEAENVSGMRASVEANEEAQEYLSRPGQAELSAFFTDDETGTQLRARFDWLEGGIGHPDLSWKGRSAIDLKKTQDITEFRKSVESYRYHVQEHVYREAYRSITGEELENYFFLAVEEHPPYTSKLFTLSPEMLEIGTFYARQNINSYANCIETSIWPGPKVSSVIEPSTWANKKFQDDDQDERDDNLF